MKIWLGSFLLVLFCKVAYPIVKKDTVPTPVTINNVKALIRKARQLTLKNPDSARKIAEEGLVLSKSTNYKKGIGACFNVIGVTYWVQSVLPISQFYLTLSVPYLKGDSSALSDCYRNIARNYVDLKDYKLALHFFKAALKMGGKDIPIKAEIYTELTSLFNATNDYDNGLMHIKFAFKYSNLAHNPNLIAILYNRLGQIYISQGKLDLAERTLDTCYDLSLKIKNRRIRSVLQIDRARLFLLKNNPAKAADYANMGYALADTIGSSELKLRALKVLTTVYQKQGNLKQASLAQNHINQLYDSVSHFSNGKTLKLIQDYADLNAKLNSIELVNNNNSANEVLIKTQNRTIVLLMISLVTAITLLIVTYVYYKQKNQMNTRLQAQHQVLVDQKKVIEIQRTDLEEVNKLKDKLLAIIGHDLRTPIASLISIADLFAMEYITADEVTKLMKDLTPVIKGAELTLSNLMDFADSQMLGHNVRASNVNVCLVADEMKETFAYQLDQKNISLNNQCISKNDVWADANHVKVVLRNLISNAIKFTNNDGFVKVISDVKEGKVLVCVEDNGVGMTPEQAGQLFNANQHFSQIGTSGERGTGLGLLLCKELIELNKGILWVETEAGKGCKFYFTLPMFVPAV
ncbi:MAG: tetratricopeptide repeat-containing sensor histidine kinase [Bacteroidota bacterium]